MDRQPLARTVVGVALAATLLASCGGSEDGGAAPSTTRPAASTAVTAAAPEPVALERPAGPVVIAHRGASAEAPEHTFASYDLAQEQGADYLEQDVQLTADDELVVFHDDTLDRTARGPAEDCTGPLVAKELAQLQRCEVGSWFGEANPGLADPAFAELRIPTLAQVLDRYGAEARYYVELKAPEHSPGVAGVLVDVLRAAGFDDAAAEARQVVVQSFSLEALRDVHDRWSALPLVLLVRVQVDPIGDAVLDEAAELAVGIGPASANVDRDLVERAGARCLVVHPYTVDDPADMAALLDAGVEGLFTNVPAVLRAEVADRPPPEIACPKG